MIYYLIFFITGVFIDYKDLKNSDKKSDITFYIIAMLLAFGLGVFYFLDTNRMGISEYFLKMFNLGGM